MQRRLRLSSYDGKNYKYNTSNTLNVFDRVGSILISYYKYSTIIFIIITLKQNLSLLFTSLSYDG